MIHQIDVMRLLILEPENNAPVAGYVHGPKAFVLAFHGVQAQPRNIHVGRLLAGIEPRQYGPDGFSHCGFYAVEENAGPLSGIFTGAGAPDVATALPESDEVEEDHVGASAAAEAESSDERWEEIHEVAANLTLLLVALHVGGVLLASFVHRENLTRAMVTGRKRPL